MNRAERELYELMRNANLPEEIEVFTKVRLADAITIDRSDLNDELYTYALKAHVDLLFTKHGVAAFAMELDGKGHGVDDDVIERDNKKDFVCKKLGLPLLRINEQYLRRIQNQTVAEHLSKSYFTNNEIDTEVISVNESCADDTVNEQLSSAMNAFPRLKTQLHETQTKLNYKIDSHLFYDPFKYCLAVTIFSLEHDMNIVGMGRSHINEQWPMTGRTVAQNMSVAEALDLLARYENGTYSGIANNDKDDLMELLKKHSEENYPLNRLRIESHCPSLLGCIE